MGFLLYSTIQTCPKAKKAQTGLVISSLRDEKPVAITQARTPANPSV